MNKFLILSSLLILNLSCTASDSKSEPLLADYAGSRINGDTFYRDGKECSATKYYSGLPMLPIARIISGKYTIAGQEVKEKEYKALCNVKELRAAHAKISDAERLGYGQLAAQENYKQALQKVGDGMDDTCCCIQ